MTSYNHPINGRTMTSFSPLENELTFEPDKNYLFDLSYLSMLQIQGENASMFLQGQLSCDVKEVDSNQYQHGALCNLKGRVLALVDVIHQEKEGYQLILPEDLMLKTQTSLEKTAMLSRVTMLPQSQYQFFGLYLQNPSDILPVFFKYPMKEYEMITNPVYSHYFLGNGLYVLIVKKNAAEELWHEFKTHHQWRGSLAWHALTLQRKQVEIYPTTRGLFLPHRLDLHHLGYLNFNKGCYKGQEIIARTHYRATLKHQLRCFSVETNEALISGQRLFKTDSTIEVGELVDYCQLNDHQYLIAASVLFDCPLTVRIEDHHQPVELRE